MWKGLFGKSAPHPSSRDDAVVLVSAAAAGAFVARVATLASDARSALIGTSTAVISQKIVG